MNQTNDLFPRSVMGLDRRQQWAHNKAEFNRVVKRSNGKASVFTSHNSYPNPEHKVNHDSPCPQISGIKYVKVQQQYFDSDSDKLSNALHDTRKIVEYFEEENLPYTVAFSGRKGFQICQLFKPAVYDIRDEIYIDSETVVPWSSYYVASQNYIKTKLKLRTLDPVVAEPKRIMRVWNTMHFKRGSTVPTGTYCSPLHPSQIIDGTPGGILDWARQPHDINFDYLQGKTWLTYDQYLDKYKISPSMLSQSNVEYSSGLISKYKPGSGKNWNWFKAMMPQIGIDGKVYNKLCYLHEHYHNHNPPHIIRFGSAAYWKKMSDDPRNQIKLDEQFVIDFYKAMKYDDFSDSPGSPEYKNLRDNVKSIWNRGPNSNRPHLHIYQEPTCQKLLAAGVCKGPRCKLFKIFLSDMYHKFTKDKQGEWAEVVEIT